MKLILFTFLIFFQLHPFIGYSEHYLDNLNVSCLEDKKKEENSSDAENQQRVYICTGQYAYAYHSRPDCPGLNNCKGEIKYTDEHTAINRLERIPCCRCWSNVKGRCIDDNPQNTFNKYVPQNPVDAMGEVGMTLQKKYDLRKDWIQRRIDELSDLLNTLYNDKSLPSFYDAKVIREKLWKNVRDYVNKISSYDFADDYYFNSIQSNFNKIEDHFYDYFDSLISSYNYKVQNESYNAKENKPNTFNNNPYKPKSKLLSKNDSSINQQFETSFDTPLSEIPMRIEPKMNSKVIYRCPNNAKVVVLDSRGELYYKVSVNGHIGYVSKSFLKKPN